MSSKDLSAFAFSRFCILAIVRFGGVEPNWIGPHLEGIAHLNFGSNSSCSQAAERSVTAIPITNGLATSYGL